MYFWRIEELKTKMTVSPLSDREALPYLVWAVTLSTMGCYLSGEKFSVGQAIEATYSVLLTIFGTTYIYKQNGGASGEYFLQRYLAIGWVVTIRWSVVVGSFVGLSVVLFISASILAGHRLDCLVVSRNCYWLTLGFFFQLVLYLRIAHHVRDVATRSKLP
ncbi:MAG: hypothetical protein NTY01_09525 [Verrucomicrobia bacterium]|nr:hypothetical protein [Verrucomicrobiota bacterium]